MRKNIKKFAGIVLCIGMFTGCAQTPDSSLVKPKGSKAVDAYTEADDVSGSKGEASESKNDDGSESKTTIRNLIDAPQNYKSHVEDDSAKLVVNTDASVEIPKWKRYLLFLSPRQKLPRSFSTVLQTHSSQRQNFIPWIVIM